MQERARRCRWQWMQVAEGVPKHTDVRGLCPRLRAHAQTHSTWGHLLASIAGPAPWPVPGTSWPARVQTPCPPASPPPPTVPPLLSSAQSEAGRMCGRQVPSSCPAPCDLPPAARVCSMLKDAEKADMGRAAWWRSGCRSGIESSGVDDCASTAHSWRVIVCELDGSSLHV